MIGPATAMLRALRNLTLTLAGFTVTIAGLALMSPVHPLLPPEGGSVCFAGHVNGAKSIVFGRSHDVTRDTGQVETAALTLARTPNQKPHGKPGDYRFDWRYDFSLDIVVRDKGTYHAGGQCDWTEDRWNTVEFALGCFIDCDGGMVDAFRVPGQKSLLLDVNRLRMSGGCGEPSTIVSGASAWDLLWVDAAPAAKCTEIATTTPP